jgi:MinD superfamily P-loop ATPase
MSDHVSGEMMLFKKDERVFSTARLKMGSGASGKLVTAVKQRLLQEKTDSDLAVIDGSPGIGCPVIASISGVDFVLIVAEPTVSGMHDMKRIIETCRHFGVDCAVCINKYDVNPGAAGEIEKSCKGLTVPVVGRIPYDETVVKAVNNCRSIAAYPDSPAGKAIEAIWDKIYNHLCGMATAEGKQNADKRF